MRWILRASMITLTLASLSAVAAAQTAAIPIGKNGDVELTESATFGTIVLEPGHYRFKHARENGQDLLVVNRQQTTIMRSAHYATGSGTEVARLPCQIVPLDGKVKNTELHTRTQPDGSRIITQIRIRREGASHLIGLEPKA